jgi:hypothetical protein
MEYLDFFSLPWFLANWHESETVGMQRRKLKTNGFGYIPATSAFGL